MPLPHPNDHAAWRSHVESPGLAMREVKAYQEEAAHPELWTVGLLSKRTCRLWGRCADCGVQKPVDLDKLFAAGMGSALIGDLKLKCQECGKPGQIVVTWVGSARQRCERNFTTGETKGSWRGAYPFRSGKEAVSAAFAELRAADLAASAPPDTAP